MAQTYHPFDAGAGANIVEAQWRAMARHWVHGGSGVLATELNKLSTIGDSTGMQVKVDTGRAWVAGHFYENDAQLTLAISSNASGNPRIDRVVIRADFTANTIAATVITGTPAASPVAPAITQSTSVWDIPLAQVAAANGAVTIAAGNVTDERPLVGPNMAAMRSPSTTARDLMVTSPQAGMMDYQSAARKLELHTGSAWSDLLNPAHGAFIAWTPVLTASTTNPTLGTGSSQTGVYMRIGRLIFAQGRILWGTGGTAGSGTYAISVPVNGTAAGFASGGVSSRIGGFIIPGLGMAIPASASTMSFYPGNSNTLAGSGSAWGTVNDEIKFFYAYEAAAD